MVFLFWLVLVLPLWVALVGLGVEVMQMKLFGNCFLTKLVHSRGYMQGMSYWEYVPFTLGEKIYKQTRVVIYNSIELMLVIIFIIGLLI